MALPTEPGSYEDCRGDIWILEEDGRWLHGARRLTSGEVTPVMGRFTGRMSPEAFEFMVTGPSADVLPLTRIQVEDMPTDVD